MSGLPASCWQPTCRAEHHDQNDEPENTAAANVSHIGKLGERQI